MKTLNEYPKKTLIGYVDNEPIFLTAPSWDCGWYWGFGYLGNKNTHYHFDSLNKNKDMHSAIVEHFGDTLQIRPSQTWEFAELMQSFYKLRETAEILGRGGAHLTSNPCANIIINKDEVNRINSIVLPAIFGEIYKIINSNQGNEILFNELVELNIQASTNETVSFMFKNKITTNDLKVIKKLTAHDVDILHTEYWRQVHANKKG